MKGMSSRFETNPGVSVETVTVLPIATANARARSSTELDVWRAGMSSTSFMTCSLMNEISIVETVKDLAYWDRVDWRESAISI